MRHPCDTAQKIKFFIEGSFSKCDQIFKKMRLWSHLLKKFLMENFIFLYNVTRQDISLHDTKVGQIFNFLENCVKFLNYTDLKWKCDLV